MYVTRGDKAAGSKLTSATFAMWIENVTLFGSEYTFEFIWDKGDSGPSSTPQMAILVMKMVRGVHRT